ncbi:MAG: NAD(P)/FAD-dependent oxidoreductase [Bdellovibrionota bacterium]|jgi:predicted Rossmann fold flavoprotein
MAEIRRSHYSGKMDQEWDVIIVGGGAAGLMCAIESGKRGRRTLLIEHCNKVGKKILISGGGRCNFTNIYASPGNYLSQNPHFCKSALSRYTPSDFIALVEKHGITYHEKKLGQLFCDGSSRQIVAMLTTECAAAGVTIALNCSVHGVNKAERFKLETTSGTMSCESLVIASGGLSIPKMGATGYGHQIAKDFGVRVTPTRAGLVPFTFSADIRTEYEELAGVSFPVEAFFERAHFQENILFTHKGVSGPAILQVSSFWEEGKAINIQLIPPSELRSLLHEHSSSPKTVGTVLQDILPKRFLKKFLDSAISGRAMSSFQAGEQEQLINIFAEWSVVPDGTEGYRTAEVTVGGVDTRDLSSKTFQAEKVEGLFFIGEVVDVTGWLGGYNFQWAWASGYCAGQYT